MLSARQAFASPPRHLFRLIPHPFACALRKSLLGSWGKAAKGKISAGVLSLCCPISKPHPHCWGPPLQASTKAQRWRQHFPATKALGRAQRIASSPEALRANLPIRRRNCRTCRGYGQCRKPSWADLDFTGPPRCRTPFLCKE